MGGERGIRTRRGVGRVHGGIGREREGGCSGLLEADEVSF